MVNLSIPIVMKPQMNTRVIQFSDETVYINHRGHRGTQSIILPLCSSASSVVFSGISLTGFNIPYEN
jgi:hypothetical protein